MPHQTFRKRRYAVKTMQLKDFVVSIDKYPFVHEKATVQDVAVALKEAWTKAKKGSAIPKEVIVLDENRHAVGKIGQLDLIVGLEDGYRKIGDIRAVSHTGFTRDFIKMMIDQHGLWQKPLAHICTKAGRIKVKDIMYTPKESEYIEESGSLDEAIHQLVIGHHRNLIVTKDEQVVGVFRLDELFSKVCGEIYACSAV
jgi:CBS domain-containing protein